jgi:hypothetical protein
LQGTLIDVAHPGALQVSMQQAGFRPRDLTRFAQRITGQVRDHIIGLARQHGVEIEMVVRKNLRQEDRIAEILRTRDTHAGLVHIFTAKESAMVYDTRHARADGYAQIITRRGACIHYYLYWIHPRLGLIHVRVPTWFPLHLQVNFNGHNWLARKLDAAAISYQMADHAFSQCADWRGAQALADQMDLRQLHAQLKELTQQCCPATAQFPNGYHGCLTQVEYAHDLVFKEAARMDALFAERARQALLAIKVEDMARFLGKRLPLSYETQVNSHLGRRHAGFPLKHSFGPASVTLYNRPGGILRLDRGFNPFLEEDERVLQIVLSGEHALVGLTARKLRRVLHPGSRGRISRLLKRLRLHGLLRKVGKTNTHHFTSLARRVVTAVLHLKNNVMVPELAAASAG